MSYNGLVTEKYDNLKSAMKGTYVEFRSTCGENPKK
jgi:hypothetical protein